jgi:hypothetical protein
MQRSRITTVSSVLAAALSVYVCLMIVDARTLAQKSSAIVAAHSQLRNGATLALNMTVASPQAERPVAESVEQSTRLSSQEIEITVNSPMPRATFCARLSTYLSLS